MLGPSIAHTVGVAHAIIGPQRNLRGTLEPEDHIGSIELLSLQLLSPPQQ